MSPVGRLIPYSRHSAALLASLASTRLTNSSLICSTVLSSQAILYHSFLCLVWLEYIKTVNHVIAQSVNYLTALYKKAAGKERSMANVLANVFAAMAAFSALVNCTNVMFGVLLIMVGLIIVSLISLIVILIRGGRACRA